MELSQETNKSKILEELNTTSNILLERSNLITERDNINKNLKDIEVYSSGCLTIAAVVILIFFTYGSVTDSYTTIANNIFDKLEYIPDIIATITFQIGFIVLLIVYIATSVFIVKLPFSLLIGILELVFDGRLQTKKERRVKDEESGRKLKETLNQLNEEISKIDNSLTQSIVPKDYRDIYAVNRLIFYFENGRADSMKEALNLYEIERQNNQIIEQARRAEIAALQAKEAALEAKEAAESSDYM